MARGVSRDLEKEAFWRGKIGEWLESGMTVSGFCRREGISANNFFRWRRVIEDRDRDQACEFGVESSPGSGCSGSDSFARVSVVPCGLSPEHLFRRDAHLIEAVLPSGLVVRVGPGFDADTLVRLLGLLDSPRC